MEGINIEIVDVNEDNFNKAYSFLKEVKALKNIEEEIVRNASVIVDKEDVVGAISYEKFGVYGLIRYFIFKKYVDDETIERLFSKLETRAQTDNISYLFSIVVENDVIDLFKNLSFFTMDKNNMFIEEERLADSKYKNTTVMAKKIDIT